MKLKWFKKAFIRSIDKSLNAANKLISVLKEYRDYLLVGGLGAYAGYAAGIEYGVHNGTWQQVYEKVLYSTGNKVQALSVAYDYVAQAYGPAGAVIGAASACIALYGLQKLPDAYHRWRKEIEESHSQE